ncbi:DME family drug/metabolite transporter [Cryobacterium mesophilum]|uniref:EamA family transporter n=1 Tax=Terrimesophilobacter mesophilus TaxID=433647 RepID=A0A4R8VCX9_9MICO|nr:EamA family transporter [Terrimesophilobacter mesophilus]MBB5633246.1 DME family drug/metabolite transporter [Terrimesophilobacter mesophilus]TFB79990.1 EamA family transporter [Terrimesophilobacter mesophilus]
MRHVVFAIIAAILFGTTGTAQALGPDGASSLSVGSARIVIGGASLALVAWWLSRRARRVLRDSAPGRPTTDMLTLHIPNLPGPDLQSAPSPRGGRRTWLVVAVGAAAIVAYQPTFFLGMEVNGVAVGAVVAIGSGPIFTGMLEWLMSRRFPGYAWLTATVIAVVGIALLAGVGEAGMGDPTGLLLSLGAGACYALYALSAKQLLIYGWTPTGSVAVIFGWSALGALPILVLSNPTWLASVDGLVLGLWLGIATITVACLFLANALKALAASTVATLGLGEPLTATLLGVLVLHETLTGTAIVGLVLVIFGLVLIGSLRARRTTRA